MDHLLEIAAITLQLHSEVYCIAMVIKFYLLLSFAIIILCAINSYGITVPGIPTLQSLLPYYSTSGILIAVSVQVSSDPSVREEQVHNILIIIINF